MTTTTLLLAAAIVLMAAVWTVRGMRRRRALRSRTQIEDALKHLFEQEYRGRLASFDSLGGALRLSDSRRHAAARRACSTRAWSSPRGQEFELTPDGERVALQIVRAHRLLERYFADEARLPLRDRSTPPPSGASTRSRRTEVDALSASLGHPRSIRTAIRFRRATARSRRRPARR